MIIELLCPDCRDTWMDLGEYAEEVEDIERFCHFCDYFGLPEKNIITNAQIQVLHTAVDRLSKKLRTDERGSVASDQNRD